MIFSGFAALNLLRGQEEEDKQKQLEKDYPCEDGQKRYKTHKWRKHKCNCELCYVEKMCQRCGQEN